MPAPNPLAIFAPRLNEAGLVWMTVGSVASSAYGEYRVTNDVDVIVVLGAEQADRVVEAFPEQEFYSPPREVIQVEAARPQRGHFNLIDHATGFKADVYIANRDAFQWWALQHRRAVEVAGTTAWIAPPEYIIIGKLEFYREGRSEKHLRDIRSLMRVTEVDAAMVEREVNARALQESWRLCQPPSAPA